jgi:hypothetical protein
VSVNLTRKLRTQLMRNKKSYSFSHDLSKEEAISQGHLEYQTWYNALPASIRNIQDGQSFHPAFLSFQSVYMKLHKLCVQRAHCLQLQHELPKWLDFLAAAITSRQGNERRNSQSNLLRISSSNRIPDSKIPSSARIVSRRLHGDTFGFHCCSCTSRPI